MGNSEAEFIEPDELTLLEKDATDLQQQLEGVQAADMTSTSVKQLVGYIKTAQEEDQLIMGEEENRWKELIERVEPEPNEVETKKCCNIT
mmetsp:Transcript_11131/g.14054  ORF Transcript_11131/g.14054 Transcript_11131/m.14054 type:complete len:90 (+) Transcript_11131:108-377(+)|eukprot:CAMPEP_0203671604 /NCGR_PEP_ID=MMETSP0090-20130426/7341_1 /ASSEMBLY_ACC=CAM_ASM_001088 /TAXON_ID=426623 /ORGANISM="Chaetoceros affinis, Strain CCMP159" /LENGTH=89 /DNA_ID=CAMNT_0050536711 /DNA_START=87 /DNA_END=356 /DNA_ORIENTATION=+